MIPAGGGGTGENTENNMKQQNEFAKKAVNNMKQHETTIKKRGG
jgi:hypothetical protein